MSDFTDQGILPAEDMILFNHAAAQSPAGENDHHPFFGKLRFKEKGSCSHFPGVFHPGYGSGGRFLFPYQSPAKNQAVFSVVHP